MQNKFNSVYSGLDELLIAEKYRNNYNKFIVENCFKKVELPNTLIDFGSGIGTLSVILKKMFNISPVCIEIDDENIKYLNDRNLQNFKDIDGVKNNVDLIFSSNVLEHIENDSLVLQSFKDKLSNNGYLYLYLPASMLLWSKVDESVGHYRRYSRSEIKQKLMLAGFEIKSVCYADSIGFVAISMMKLLGYQTDQILESPETLKFYDRYIFPLSKFLDLIGFKFLFGKNIIAVARKIN